MNRYNDHRCHAGWSLVELLVALLISSILLGSALPGMLKLKKRYEVDTERHQFATLINTARHAAINFSTIVTLCPGNAGVCASRNQWHLGAFAFNDSNNNRQKEPGEQILATIGKANRQIKWRSFRNRSALQFKATGLTAWQNGHFLFCPEDGDARYARQLVLNSAGRLYYSHDTDNDGIHEDVRGQPLTC